MNNQEEIKKHKTQISREILAKGSKVYKDFLFADRMVKSLLCEDCDSIPKVEGAGQIFDRDSTPFQLMYNGVKLRYKEGYDEWTADLIRGFRGHHEPQQEKVFYEVLKSIPAKGVMIELGCLWAYYSLTFAKQIPASKNYLIEPCSRNLDFARKNFALNQLRGSFIQGHIYAPAAEEGHYEGSVRIEIDEFLNKNQIDHVNILHSDIQGAEGWMLRSAEQSIRSGKIDYFFISTHYDYHQPCLDFLRGHNYKIIAEHSLDEGYLPDGLIVAKRHGVAGPECVQISKRKEGRIWT